MARIRPGKSIAIRAKSLGLKPREAKFVEAYVRLGKQAAVAKEMGISKQRASQLYNSPDVHAAIFKELEWQMAADAATGMSVLRDLAEDSEDESVRLRAAKELVNRSLGPPKEVKEHKHTHELGQSAEALMTRIAELQDELGLDRKAVDVEYEEVEEAAQPGGALTPRLPFQIK